jgi:hypothetical protein
MLTPERFLETKQVIDELRKARARRLFGDMMHGP